MNKIAVIAGTPIDTKFGEQFLKRITNNKVLHYAVSKTPDEQNIMQLNNPKKLFSICLNKCLEFKTKGVKQVVIYCNSLSSAIDIEKLKEKTEIEIITPLDVYRKISNKYKNILIIAANSVGTILPEKIIRERNKRINITTLGYLSLVNQIEMKLPPSTIFHSSGLNKILEFAKETNIDLILLACTHFPYISNILRQNSGIDVLDLDNEMKKLII